MASTKSDASKPVNETRTESNGGGEIKAPKGSKPITFTVSYGVYNPLETAGFQEARANEIVEAGFAVHGADVEAAKQVIKERASAAGKV